jgi:sulfatase maturation enzyme AslB (radical SAM superfamily)
MKPETPLPAGDTRHDYAHTNSRKVLRINSSGLCNLDCPYCFTNHAKKAASMSNGDIDFLFERLGEDILFIFTGVGDFFAGYQAEQRFLHNITQHNAELFLDANGVILHEFQHLSEDNMEKIRFFDVSYHYSTMKNKKLLERWADNMTIIADRMAPSRFIIKTIFAFPEMEIWKDILEFHAKHVFAATGKKLTIVLDEFDTRMQNKAVLKMVNTLISLYSDSVVPKEYVPTAAKGQTHYEMATSLSQNEPCNCPAGSRYFKIDVDGNILPCDLTGGFLADRKVVLGNTKKRQLFYLKNEYQCAQVQGPCCIKYWDDRYPRAARLG